MRRLAILALLLVCGQANAAGWAAGDPTDTVRAADQVLAEIMAAPGRRIPEALLAEAQGIAIIPDVIKIGFVAGARRGHGVVMVRDAEGEWSLPQFVTLTGGSVGWQAGIQGTDVILVFTTKKGVQGLMSGKFTIGADASVAAGPVGRNAAAATDATLKSEILSYSRSRGLFLGVAIDGSALEIDAASHAAYYGTNSPELPQRVHESAIRLRQDLVNLTAVAQVPDAGLAGAAPVLVPAKAEAIRRALDRDSRQLFAIIDPTWQQYLALPKEVYETGEPPRADALAVSVQRYDTVAKTPAYQRLAQRPEFQSTYELLREYLGQLAPARPLLELPAPPPAKN
jgi:SH3 domain-containing YSC84-like protein 1